MPKTRAPKFGIKKIGRAKFELEKAQKIQTRHFGPRKFGKKKAALMQAVVDEAAEVVELEATKKEGKPVEPELATGTTSIKQVDEALQENPIVYEELYKLEFDRAEGVRKGAMRLFLAAEVGREEGPREDRMAEIEGYLKKKK